MILKNRFKEEDKHRVWEHHKYCALCSSNQNCSLHHIKSTESDSILNSIMLCFTCHKMADGRNVSDQKFMAKCLQYTIRQVLQEEYVFIKRDLDFYIKNKNLFELQI